MPARSRDIPGAASAEMALHGSLISGVPPITGSAEPRVAPGLYRMRVAEALRDARQAQGLTQRQAAAALEWSMSKLVRIEAGTTRVSVTDLRALLDLYHLTDPAQASRLAAMTRAARQRPWFSRHRAVTPDLACYLQAERSAAVIGGFRIIAVPGLLQTADYAMAVLRGLGADRVDERVELLLARQQLLGFEDCPEICYVLDEAVLHRCTGGPSVMAAQLDRLHRISAHPRVSVHVLPFTASACPPAASFTLTGFGGADGSAVFHQAADGRLIWSRDRSLADRYQDHLARMRAMAQPLTCRPEIGAVGTALQLLPAFAGWPRRLSAATPAAPPRASRPAHAAPSRHGYTVRTCWSCTRDRRTIRR